MDGHWPPNISKNSHHRSILEYSTATCMILYDHGLNTNALYVWYWLSGQFHHCFGWSVVRVVGHAMFSLGSQLGLSRDHNVAGDICGYCQKSKANSNLNETIFIYVSCLLSVHDFSLAVFAFCVWSWTKSFTLPGYSEKHLGHSRFISFRMRWVVLLLGSHERV